MVLLDQKKSNSCTWRPLACLGSPGVLQIGCLGMLWLTNAAAVPTTPPGRGDRAVSVGRSLQTGWKGTLYPARNSGAGCPGMGRGSQNHEKRAKKAIENLSFLETVFGGVFVDFWGPKRR